MIRNKILIGLAFFFLNSCSYKEDIEFLRLQEVKVDGIENGELRLNVNAVFNNPNSMKGKLKAVHIYVIYKGDSLAYVHEVEKMIVHANADFTLPLTLSISINKLQKGLLSNLTALLRKKSVELEFIGEVKVGRFGLSQTIPVRYKEEIKF